MNFKRINVMEAKAMLDNQTAEQPVQVVDIRDDAAYAAGHMPSAVHIHNSNIQEFIAEADLDSPLLVCCYHGNMSQSAAAYFAEQGFADTYSVDGGFEAWKSAVSES